MKNLRALASLLALAFALSGCWTSVPRENVYGTYIAVYPFGSDTVTLERNGTFEQRVAIGSEGPVVVHGSWSFDKDGDIRFLGLMQVADGFGHLNSEWRRVVPEISILPVELLWFRVTLGSGAEYPYVKQ